MLFTHSESHVQIIDINLWCKYGSGVLYETWFPHDEWHSFIVSRIRQFVYVERCSCWTVL